LVFSGWIVKLAKQKQQMANRTGATAAPVLLFAVPRSVATKILSPGSDYTATALTLLFSN